VRPGWDEKVPKVSIGFPVRNGRPYLMAAIRSVLEQTEQDFEIIISDNDSTDGSSDFLRDVAGADSRIKYIRQERPIRVYDNFRVVLQEARGEFFMWAAHDDTRDVDYVARLVAALENQPEAVMAFGDLNVVTPEDPVGHIRSFPFQTSGMGRLARLSKLSHMQCYYIYGVWRLSAIRQVPYAYCAWWPDLPMMLSEAILGSFVYVPGTRFHYLELPKSSLERVKTQDYADRFSLILGVAELVVATYHACANVGGMMLGVYAASLVIFKQIVNLPSFFLRRVNLILKKA